MKTVSYQISSVTLVPGHESRRATCKREPQCWNEPLQVKDSRYMYLYLGTSYMYCSSTAVGVAHVLAAPLQSADGVDNYMWHTAYCIHGLQLSACNLDSLQLRNRGRESLPRISWQAICVAETLLVLFEYTTIHHESNQQISNVDISLTTCT